ncbi:hypothetical protein [Longitalea arenae]|uniref:hypothetical protein n=1 Tax=Longitalea arenae TaxID=2812558 RepID=UPI0019687280|nr:hypothetical protein [Longitalea arenae]
MINERNIAEKFSAIWKQNFPMLTPNFIKIFNETQVNLINLNAVSINDGERYDLVSEASFKLAELVIQKNCTPSDYLSHQKSLSILLENTAQSIWRKGGQFGADIKLTNSELKDLIQLSNNLLEFIHFTKKEDIQFRPKLKGYGFIPDLEADLSIDDTLYEVKTVTRNFKSTDLKQLFIYLALRQVSEGNTWQYAGLYNPRKGTFTKFNVKKVIYNLSGGYTPNEAFGKLLDGLVRDIEIDTTF